MERIASFCVDHTNLKKGIYVSRIDGDITTYDVRMRLPNKENVLDNAAIHTIEHLFATFVRNSEQKDNVIYFGPMGCRTGFYFLTRSLDNEAVLNLVKSAFDFIANFKGKIPGASAVECGNYKEHDLIGALNEAKQMVTTLKPITVDNMKY